MCFMVGPFLGVCIGKLVYFQLCVALAADTVSVAGSELPYVPLRDSFASYTEDSWTFDGR